jgi:Flp pilus assembly protein TadG
MRNLHRDEDGVTVVIVVLSLIAMFGMLVIVVDVGGLLLKRREMVNGSDSAALAAAKTCASQPDTTDPEAQADTYAMSNVGTLNTGSGGIVTDPNCDTGESGYVTVEYTSGQKLFFAPVLGAGNNGNVVTDATAAWGPLGGGAVVPIVIQSETIQGTCKIPDPDFDPNTDPPKDCPLWFNNGDTLGSGDWGFMNLDEWGVDPGDNCPNGGASPGGRSGWILNNYGVPLYLKGDPPGSLPTYVCSDGGHANRDWSDLVSRMQANPILLFPVNDCTGQLDQQGNPDPCVAGNVAPRNVGKYDIVGFVKLKLIQVLQGNDTTLTDGTPCAVDCGGTNSVTQTCNTTLGNPVANGVGFGEWSLGALATSSACGASKTPDSITGVSVTSGNGSNKVTYAPCTSPSVPAGCDYLFNSTAPYLLDWYNGASGGAGGSKAKNYDVHFTWTVNGTAPTPGICHPHTSDSNAICIETQYLGFDTGGNVVGVGQLFGTFGYVLCDRNLGTCPGQ